MSHRSGAIVTSKEPYMKINNISVNPDTQIDLNKFIYGIN